MSELQEEIFKGATRPAMLADVPLIPMVCLIGLALLLGFWGGMYGSIWISVLVVLATIPTYVWMRVISKKDDQRLRQMFVAVKLVLINKNRGLWRSRSYSPIQMRDIKNTYRR